MPSINRRIDILESDNVNLKRRVYELEQKVEVLEKQHDGVVKHIESMMMSQEVLASYMTNSMKKLLEDIDV